MFIVSGFLFGALIGFLAWPHCIALAPLALVSLPLWNRRHWLAPAASMLGYHLATTWGLIHGTVDFFPHAGVALGLAFWVFSSLVFALPYVLYRWSFCRLSGKSWWSRFLAGVIVTTLLSSVSTVLPPLGLIGWTSPWIGAIASGWWVIFLVILTIGLASVPFVYPELFLSGALVGSAFFIFTFTPGQMPPPPGWAGVNTRFGELSGLSYVQASMRLEPRVLHALSHGDRVVLTPESIAGPWLPGTKAIWQPVLRYTAAHKGKVALIGADIPLRDGGYEDALVQMQDGRETILPDRIPVPFSMWHPWQMRDSFPMRVFGKPEVGTVDGLRVGYLICYEQLLVWLAISLFQQHIQVLLAPANDWWAEGTDIPAIQRASAKAWGHFLGVPVLFAVNR